MKNAKKTLALGLVLLGGLSAATAHAAGLSSQRKILEFRLFNADGGATFLLDGDIPTTCGTTTKDRSQFRVTNETVVRGLEAAFLAGKPIRVVATNSCSGVFDNVSEVYFYP
jgi:hypothetical protein